MEYNVWNVYPRPQLVRDRWMNLNGEWILNKNTTIIVPFCPESELSGLAGQPQGNQLTYERTFAVPAEWTSNSNRILLHIGAADQEAQIFINDKKAGEHYGGYLPFSVDITDYLDLSGTNTLRIELTDELNHKYPWGKQKRNRGGMWYTPVSGIWKTVWLEPVPEQHIESLKIDNGLDWVEIRAYGVDKATIQVLGETHEMRTDEKAGTACASIHLNIRKPHNWTPDDPYLYGFIITTDDDEIRSYFALRTLGITEESGYKKLCLNGKPYFFNGVLDQGYWQDGLYTPAIPQCYESDIMAMKSLGFNTLRKHIKIEPEQFYYDCDRLGMIVFQDMVNNGDYSFIRDSVLPTVGIRKLNDRNAHNNEESRRIFINEMEQTVKHLYNHPSICYWTIFNEGWGQFCADEMYDRLADMDHTRFIDSTSGWFTQKKSDVDSYHVYFKKVDIRAGSRPLVLSEFGGYACKLKDHCFNPDKTYGYRKCASEAVLLSDLSNLYNKEILPLKDRGLCAAIYTQLSDVEDETNGFLTYDRKVQKMKAYTGTGRVEIIGNHTDHQGGKVLACPTNEKIRAYVADNHESIIRIISEGFDPVEIDVSADTIEYEQGTTTAIVAGLLAGFAQRHGKANLTSNGFDAHINSEIGVGSGLSSSAAFEILLARIINDKYYDGVAAPVELAKIGKFAENEYYGKPCGLQDQLAISLGRMVLMDFNGKEPEYEFIDFDFEKAGYRMKIIATESDHAKCGAEFASIPEDMLTVAHLMGLERLGDISKDRFLKQLPMLEEKLADGTITELQLNRARHFYDETERVLAGAVALQAGNVQKFLACVNASGQSSETLLRNILPPGVEENALSQTLAEYRAKPTTAALKLEGGGFGGSVMVFEKL